MLNKRTNRRVPPGSVKFKRSLLAFSVMALSSPSLLLADNGPEGVEEVVVRGIRASLENAQDIKKNADTVKDVITASDIGALPDKSVTEALQRVPGVTVGRFASPSDPNHFAAEGRGVLVRGLDRVHSQFNGRDSFSAGNWAAGLSFEDVPPELLGSVEVVKNQTSDIISGGIAGTVNLVTRKPFDSEGRKVFVSVKDSYGDLVGTDSPALSGLYSDRWEASAGDFGFLISGATSKFNARGDGMNLTNFYERSATQTEFAGLDTSLAGHANEKLYMPVGLWLRTADSDRSRTGLDTSLQWQNPDQTIKATAEFIRSKSVENWREHVLFPTDDSQGFAPDFTAVQLDPTKPATFDENGYFTSGTITYPWNTAMLTSSRSDHTESVVRDSSFKLEINPNDQWTIKLDAQHLNTGFHRQNNSINNRFSQSDVTLDLRGKTPKVEFLGTNHNPAGTPAGWMGCPAGDNPGTTDLSDPQGSCNYYQVSIMDTNVDAEGTLDAFTADVQYKIDGDWLKSVSGGAYFSDVDRTTQDDNYANWGNVSNTWGQLPMSGLADHPEISEKFTFDSDFFNGKGLVGANRTFLFPKISDTRESNLLAYDQYLLSKGISNGGWRNRHIRFTIDGKPTDAKGYLPFETVKTSISRMEEYVRFDFANDELAMPVKANLGLRHVSYEVEATGTSVYNDASKSMSPTQKEFFASHYPDYMKFFNGDGSSVDTQKPDAYTATLPSFNLSLSLREDLIARIALSKAIYFPSLYDMRNTRNYSLATSFTPSDSTQVPTAMTAVPSGTGGNPNLKPEESKQLDVTLEWYYSKSTSLTFSAFYKDLDNLFRERNYATSVVNPLNGTSVDMTVRQQVNEGSGTISGFEVAYQQFYDFLPGAWSGLGSQINYTYVKPKDLADQSDSTSISVGGDRNLFRNFTGLSLPGLSENTLNFTAMYQYAGIEARLAYNWRSEYLVTRRDADAFAPIFAKAAGYLDASLWYTINDNWRVGVEGSNLLNTMTETTTQFNQAGVTTPKTFSTTDRRYAVSVRASF
ncbi:MAG TPA: TonB-dependent receptor [Cellvibrio sp.]